MSSSMGSREGLNIPGYSGKEFGNEENAVGVKLTVLSIQLQDIGKASSYNLNSFLSRAGFSHRRSNYSPLGV